MVASCVHIVDVLGVAAAADDGLDAAWSVAAIADALEREIHVCAHVCVCTKRVY